MAAIADTVRKSDTVRDTEPGLQAPWQIFETRQIARCRAGRELAVSAENPPVGKRADCGRWLWAGDGEFEHFAYALNERSVTVVTYVPEGIFSALLARIDLFFHPSPTMWAGKRDPLRVENTCVMSDAQIFDQQEPTRISITPFSPQSL